MVSCAQEVVVRASAEQIDFLYAPEQAVLAYGGWGSGKTYMLCVILMRLASEPGARVLLCRKTLESLKQTTLVTLLKGDGDTPPVLPEGTYDWNKNEKVISLHDGGEIIYLGVDNPTRRGSLNLTDVCIDEAHEFTRDEWEWVTKRARVQTGRKNMIRASCNPAAPSHFLAELFGLGSKGKPLDGHRAIHIPPGANRKHLPSDFLARLDALPPVARARYYEGRWVSAEGMVWPAWDRSVNVRPREAEWGRVVGAIDDGFDAPFVMLVIGRDGSGRAHVLEEVRGQGWTYTSKIAAMRRARERWSIDHFAIDDEAAGLVAEARESGLPAKAAGKGAVFDGLMRVAQMIPNLTVDPSCAGLIAEVEGYEWKRDKDGNATDEPKKLNDHGPDALRYGMLELCRAPLKPLVVSKHAGHDDEDDDRGWR